MSKNNKLVKFFNSYASENSVIDNNAYAPDNVNYLTDKDLMAESNEVVSKGIKYGTEAKSNIINSMLRQVTLITYNVAQLLAKYGDYDIDSTTSNEQILASLEKSINTLAKNVADTRINHAENKLDRDSSAALTDNGQRLVSERTVFHAIKNDVTTGPSVSGYALDARQGKVLSDKIASDLATEVTKINTNIANASNAIKQDLKIKYLGSTTDQYPAANVENESGFLYIWKGTQANYNIFLGKNSAIISRVFAIIE